MDNKIKIYIFYMIMILLSLSVFLGCTITNTHTLVLFLIFAVICIAYVLYLRFTIGIAEIKSDKYYNLVTLICVIIILIAICANYFFLK